MTATRTYLDHNATEPLRVEARAAMLAAMDRFGNPSSVHAEGRAARAVVEEAREQVAALVNAKPGEIVFTSGATEANAMAIGGRAWHSLLFGTAEHVAVLAPARRATGAQTELPCGANGVHDIAGVEAWALGLPQSDAPAFASLALANGETGVLQPVAELSALLSPFNVVTHCDAPQAAGRRATTCTTAARPVCPPPSMTSRSSSAPWRNSSPGNSARNCSSVGNNAASFGPPVPKASCAGV